MSGKLTRTDVEDIIAILDKSSFDEFRIETEDFKIHLRRSSTEGSSVPFAAPIVAASSTQPTQMHAPIPPVAATISGAVEVLAPMLGVFFHAPKPGAEPFVKAGSRVTADTTIGIIEVMKLMNTVAAGISGEVVELLAPDGKLVEFGQPLLRVKPA